jgi:hypothetical protein
MLVYVVNPHQDNIQFFTSLEILQNQTNLKVKVDKKIKINVENCEYFIYECENNENDIYEYDFKQNESISFMQCFGPSSECEFLIKKSKKEFIKEATEFMDLVEIESEDEEMIITYKNYPEYNEILYGYYTNDELISDIMCFKFIDINILNLL